MLQIYRTFDASADWLLGEDIPMRKIENSLVEENINESYTDLTLFEQSILKCLDKPEFRKKNS